MYMHCLQLQIILIILQIRHENRRIASTEIFRIAVRFALDLSILTIFFPLFMASLCFDVIYIDYSSC